MTGVILNPASGRGRAGHVWPRIEPALRHSFDPLEVKVTACPGDATRLARALLDRGVETILVAGGDGTCNEVANAGAPCLGVLPVGSAGDFSRALGAPRRWRAGIEWLRRARPAPIDIGVATFPDETGARQTRRFLNMASFGLGGRVVKHTHQAYLWSAVQELRRGEYAPIDLCIDGEPHSLTLLHGAVGNGRYQGGGMQVCPRALFDDGWLEITTIAPITLLELVRNLRRVYGGGILEHPQVRAWRARAISAASPARVPLELDGEPVGYLPADFRVLPSAICVLR